MESCFRVAALSQHLDGTGRWTVKTVQSRLGGSLCRGLWSEGLVFPFSEQSSSQSREIKTQDCQVMCTRLDSDFQVSADESRLKSKSKVLLNKFKSFQTIFNISQSLIITQQTARTLVKSRPSRKVWVESEVIEMFQHDWTRTVINSASYLFK